MAITFTQGVPISLAVDLTNTTSASIGGTLPAGVTAGSLINGSIAISGTPTTAGQSYNITLSATNAASGCTATSISSVSIASGTVRSPGLSANDAVNFYNTNALALTTQDIVRNTGTQVPSNRLNWSGQGSRKYKNLATTDNFNYLNLETATNQVHQPNIPGITNWGQVTNTNWTTVLAIGLGIDDFAELTPTSGHPKYFTNLVWTDPSGSTTYALADDTQTDESYEYGLGIATFLVPKTLSALQNTTVNITSDIPVDSDRYSNSHCVFLPGKWQEAAVVGSQVDLLGTGGFPADATYGTTITKHMQRTFTLPANSIAILTGAVIAPYWYLPSSGYYSDYWTLGSGCVVVGERLSDLVDGTATMFTAILANTGTVDRQCSCPLPYQVDTGQFQVGRNSTLTIYSPMNPFI